MIKNINKIYFLIILLALLGFFFPIPALILIIITVIYIYSKQKNQSIEQQLQTEYLSSLAYKKGEDLKNANAHMNSYLQTVINSIATPIFLIEKNSEIGISNQSFLTLFPNCNLPFALKSFISTSMMLEKKATILLKIHREFYQILATPSVDAQKKITGMLFILTDVTETKNIQLAQETFIAHASHELKTPLTVIRGATEIIEAQTQDAPHDFAKMILAETNQMERLINQLIDLTKLKSRTYIIKKKQIAGDTLITTAASRLKNQAALNQNNIILDIQTPLPILADGQLFEQVLLNILVNAIKYSPSKSDITICATHIEQLTKIIISNASLPISQQELRQFFVPFFRMNTAEKGNGLGLSISKKIIELHGGDLKVSYQKESRQIFLTITLPDTIKNSALS